MRKRWSGIFQGLLVAYDPELRKNLVTGAVCDGPVASRSVLDSGLPCVTFSDVNGEYVSLDRSMISGNRDTTRTVFAFLAADTSDSVDSPIWDTGRKASKTTGQYGCTSFNTFSGQLRCQLIDADSDQQYFTTTTAVLSNGVFHTVAFTWNGGIGTGTMPLYVDGKAQETTRGTTGTPTSTLTSSSFQPEIGRRFYSGGTEYNFRGSIAYVLAWSYPLSAQEIAWLHENRFTLLSMLRQQPSRVSIPVAEVKRPPLLARRSALSSGDPYFNNVGVLAPLQCSIYDKSKSPKTVSYSSGQIAATPEYTTFSGATGWIGYASSSAWDLADKDFTIEIEFYQTARPNTAGIVNHENTNVAAGWSLLTHSVAGDQLKFAANSDNSTNIVTLLGGVPALNTWHRIAVVRRGNWWGLYRNEQLVTSAEASGTIQNANTTLYLGIIQFSGAVNGSYDFTGRMRNLRITKGIARDIGRERFGLVSYPQHGVPTLTTRIPTYMQSESVRVPVMAKSSIGGGDPHFNNVVAQIPLRESFKERSKFARAVTTYGNVNIVGDCANFDGTGDYFTIANSTAFSFITEDFTIEGWVRFNSVGTTSTIVCKGALAGTYYPHWRVFLDGTTSKLYYELGRAWATISRSLTLGNTALAAGRWYHFAFTRSGSTLRGFLDGKLDAIATLSITPLDSSYGLYVGNSNLNNELNGSVRDLRITKGVARYVSDFTPIVSLPAPHGVAPPYGLE